MTPETDKLIARLRLLASKSPHERYVDQVDVAMFQAADALQALSGRVEVLTGVLLDVEWGNEVDLSGGGREIGCPWCQAAKSEGHEDHCKLKAALSPVSSVVGKQGLSSFAGGIDRPATDLCQPTAREATAGGGVSE